MKTELFHDRSPARQGRLAGRVPGAGTDEETKANVTSVAVFHEGEGTWLSAGS